MGKDLSSSIEHNFVERKATELSSAGFKEIARLKWLLVIFSGKTWTYVLGASIVNDYFLVCVVSWIRA